MTIAILVISALSLAVQIAVGASLILAARAFYKGLTAPLSPKQPVQPTQPEKPRIRLVEDK